MKYCVCLLQLREQDVDSPIKQHPPPFEAQPNDFLKRGGK